jgi:hypothetical protein
MIMAMSSSAVILSVVTSPSFFKRAVHAQEAQQAVKLRAVGAKGAFAVGFVLQSLLPGSLCLAVIPVKCMPACELDFRFSTPAVERLYASPGIVLALCGPAGPTWTASL